MNSQSISLPTHRAGQRNTASTDPELDQLEHRMGMYDAEAEAQLCSDYLVPLTRYAARLTGNNSTADDLAQDTLRIAIERLRRSELRESGRLWSFLRATARNLFLYDLRKTKRRNTWSMPELPEIVDDRSVQLTGLLSREAAELVRSLIGQLRNERDRNLLERIYVRQESTEAVCQELGLGAEHLPKVLFRARKRLKKLACEHPVAAELMGRAA